MATKEQRDARLTALGKAVDAWYDKCEKDITDRVALSKKILKGRTGSERLTHATNEAGQTAVVNEISDFLTGD